jgi:hypothetical protein
MCEEINLHHTKGAVKSSLVKIAKSPITSLLHCNMSLTHIPPRLRVKPM